ncbi:hypothetical protein AJ80_06512 [Polytolypa hystricis UAMH7299]|uniref:Centromere protein Cenp-K n=1 Tax=Polytolypa hystricis (strain UAMH7299) TaxID=1447883 RepID=A0A2B7XWU8_POLH7|nr:hypothetical protein AJ80_06512 [Polytolypa hystricis UAMH7299]
MASNEDILKKIRVFSENVHKLEEERANDRSSSDIDHQAYNRRLDQTLRALQDQVRRQEVALEELRLSKQVELPRPDLDPIARLAQIRRAAAAYKALSNTEPELPAANSPLAGLLALRETARLAQELKETISVTAKDLASGRERLKTEEGNLRDAQMIETEFRERIQVLRAQRPEDRRKNPAQLAKQLIAEQQVRQREFQKKTDKLKAALEDFIDKHLASMLAAEDLGGPVVGDQVNVSDVTLEAGYTAHGKERKPKASTDSTRDSRQQRIDELVHRQSRDSDAQGGTRSSNKREAAGEEVHNLLNALLEAVTTSSYIDLDRESAASRFLVKAKIAQFHPRDSRRLRLIDFGRELVD